MGMYDKMVSFFQTDGWNVVEVQGETAVVARFEGDNGEFSLQSAVVEEDTILIVHTVLDAHAPEEKRATMTELLARINFGLYIGNFEIDLDDGELRFKASVDVEGLELDELMVRNCVYTACLSMDRFLPALVAVLESDVSAVEALQGIEG